MRVAGALANRQPLDFIASAPPEHQDLVNAYFVARDTGLMPWECGLDIPRRKFRHVATVMAQAFVFAELYHNNNSGCPLLG